MTAGAMNDQVLPPGPRVPGAGQAVLWGLRFPQFTRAAHERFGPTFTVRPGSMGPMVVTTDRDAIRQLFTGDPLRKHHGNEVVRPLIGDRSVLLLGPTEHLARRKLLLPPFHGERVRVYAGLVERLMSAQMQRWRPGETVAVLPIAQDVTIDVILQAVLGVADQDTRRRFRTLIDAVLFYPFDAIRRRGEDGRAPWVAPSRRLREASSLAAGLPTPAVMTYFPQSKVRAWWNVGTWRWWRHHDRLMALLDEHVALTRRDPGLAEREDVLAMLVQARDEDGHALSDQDLRDELVTLITAGHETTAAAIAWGAVLLAHDPAVRERAVSAAQEGDDAYLAALVKEVLRIRPPIPIAAGRVLDEPLEIGPHRVPAGTPILIDAWGVHHDPARYPEPDVFRPERFLDATAQPYTWLPFGGGAHRCVGVALAELEIKVALATILRQVALEPAEVELAPVARRGLTLVPHGGGRIRVGLDK